MKKAVVIINVGDLDYAETALSITKKYYDHFGIEVRVITKHHPETVNTSPCWIKSVVYDLFDDLDFVLLQDLDIIPVDTKYNIFDFLMFDQLNFATDATRVGRKISDNGSNSPFFRWNAGLFGYPKYYKKFFRQVFDYGLPDPRGDHLFDQYYINEFIGANELYVNEIPHRFNTFFNPDLDYSTVSFCHYTNYMGSRDKLRYIQKYHPKDILCSSQISA